MNQTEKLQALQAAAALASRNGHVTSGGGVKAQLEAEKGFATDEKVLRASLQVVLKVLNDQATWEPKA